MWRPQLRATVWRLMVAIALIAVVMAAAVSPRWRTCSQEANYHASEERSFLQSANFFDDRAASLPGNGPEATVSIVLAAGFRQKAADHARSRGRWERARWFLWTALPPIGPRRDSHGSPRAQPSAAREVSR
jgi:hypothetical protein